MIFSENRFSTFPDHASVTSQEERLELNGGVGSPLKSRGGTPTGERVPLARAPHPLMRNIKHMHLPAFRLPFCCSEWRVANSK
jgi:hypothetical protein